MPRRNPKLPLPNKDQLSAMADAVTEMRSVLHGAVAGLALLTPPASDTEAKILAKVVDDCRRVLKEWNA